MPTTTTRAPDRAVADLETADLGTAGIEFVHGDSRYRTTGEDLAHGGMGTAFVLERRPADDPAAAPEPVVGKVFHADYIYQLRTDEVTLRDHETVVASQGEIAAIGHPNLLPTYVAEPIADNYLTVTPKKHDTLRRFVAQAELTAQTRLDLLIQALRGLGALHDAGFVHRDFTLRNILVDDTPPVALLFDFDLTLSLARVRGTSYRRQYQGRIFGSPGFSVAPEILDPELMELELSPRLDIYAVGGALFSLFTNDLPHGDAEDMWSLLLRVSEGLVVHGYSHVRYPDTVPAPIRPVIDACLERDPRNRPQTVDEVISRLLEHQGDLTGVPVPDDDLVRTLRDSSSVDRIARLDSIHQSRPDPAVTKTILHEVDRALSGYGYEIHKSLGVAKSRPIFLAAPIPELVVKGQFPDANTYPKIVTAIDLREDLDPRAVVNRWLGEYVPILRRVRQGLLTSLYRAAYDDSGYLFLFSEYVDDARFGHELYDHNLPPEVALALAFFVTRQVATLHEHGLAHNNIDASSLLFKGRHDVHRARPAMIGLVAPSRDPDDMQRDVQRLAGLILGWLRPPEPGVPEPRFEPVLEPLRQRLEDIAIREQRPGIDLVIAAVASGLSGIDANFRVLRDHGGDLHDYAMLIVGHALYGRLWRR